MEKIAQKLVSGQNEINRMQSELKMLTGMLGGMISVADISQHRCFEFKNHDESAFWRVSEGHSGIWFECFGRPLVEEDDTPHFVLNWKSANAPESEMTNGLSGVKMAHDQLDVLVEGMLTAYPYLQEKVQPFFAAA